MCTANVGALSPYTTLFRSTVNLPLTFASGFTGSKNIWSAAHDAGGGRYGFGLISTYTPNAVTTPPTVVSVTPRSGSGSSQTFALHSSDPNGWNYISSTEML